MTITTVNPKGQVTIPEPLRSKYGFRPGTKVTWVEREGQLIPVPVMSLRQLEGCLRPRSGDISLAEALLEDRRAERAREVG